MPSKKSVVNKTQAIRDYLAANPDAMPKVVQEDLKKQGIDVKTQRISIVKTMLKSEGGSRAEVRGPSGGRKTRAAKSREISLDALRKAKVMADRLGGVDRAKGALDALAELMGTG